MPFSGEGVFAARYPAFSAALNRFGADAALGDRRFVAHNFLVEERLSAQRAAAYHPHVTPPAAATFDTWYTAHKNYYNLAVNPGKASGVFPAEIEPGLHASCPETFRDRAAYSGLGAELDVELVRVVEAELLRDAWSAASPPLDFSTFIDCVRLVVRARRADWAATAAVEQARELAQILEVSAEAAPGKAAELVESALHLCNRDTLDLRPTFVGLWEDVADLFTGEPEADPAGWGNDLRDRFGLAHYDPRRSPRGPFPILVFKYPVRAVPRCAGHGEARPLVVPTVLDNLLAEAFCPVPRGERYGRTVDLRPARPGGVVQSVREMVHPSTPLRLDELFQMGQVDQPIGGNLASARQRHLNHLGRVCGATRTRVRENGRTAH